jgi:FK506-binding nuclear protein
MSFFGLECKKDLEFSHELPAPLRLTMASLPHDLAVGDVKGRTTLLVSADEEEFLPVCSLIPGRCEQQVLDLEFEPGTVLALRVQGPNSISVMGVFGMDMGMFQFNRLYFRISREYFLSAFCWYNANGIIA